MGRSVSNRTKMKMKFFFPDATEEVRLEMYHILCDRAQGPANLALCVDAVCDLRNYGFDMEEAVRNRTPERLLAVIDATLIEIEKKQKARRRVVEKHSNYSKLSRIIEGAIDSAFHFHPDYLTPKGAKSAKKSLLKRIAGQLHGFVEQSSRKSRK